MNYLCRFFILTFAACAAVGCAPPTGSIYNKGSDKKHDSASERDAFWTVPNRMHYIINDPFDRQEDLSVFAVFKGIVEAIPTDQVEISIIEDPERPTEPVPIPRAFPDEFYIFRKPGRNIVVVSYNEMSARYSVEVNDPYNLSGDPDDDGNGGIIIIWP